MSKRTSRPPSSAPSASVPSGERDDSDHCICSVEGAVAEEADVARERREQRRTGPFRIDAVGLDRQKRRKILAIPTFENRRVRKVDEGRVRLRRSGLIGRALGSRALFVGDRALGVRVDRLLCRQSSLGLRFGCLVVGPVALDDSDETCDQRQDRDHPETNERAAEAPVLSFPRAGPFLDGDAFGIDETRADASRNAASSGVNESVRSTASSLVTASRAPRYRSASSRPLDSQRRVALASARSSRTQSRSSSSHSRSRGHPRSSASWAISMVGFARVAVAIHGEEPAVDQCGDHLVVDADQLALAGRPAGVLGTVAGCHEAGEEPSHRQLVRRREVGVQRLGLMGDGAGQAADLVVHLGGDRGAGPPVEEFGERELQQRQRPGLVEGLGGHSTDQTALEANADPRRRLADRAVQFGGLHGGDAERGPRHQRPE